MTTEQLQLAQQMRASGITQAVIAAYFGVSASTINRKLKNNGQLKPEPAGNTGTG